MMTVISPTTMLSAPVTTPQIPGATFSAAVAAKS